MNTHPTLPTRHVYEYIFDIHTNSIFIHMGVSPFIYGGQYTTSPLLFPNMILKALHDHPGCTINLSSFREFVRRQYKTKQQ